MKNDYPKHRPKIVVIGGGTGLPVILKPLKEKKADITAIVTVADDGGSSGILRNRINVVPPGDIRNVIAALSTLPKEYLKLFQYRFKKTDDFLSGHTLGNLVIAALCEINGDIFKATQHLSHIMHIDGKVYPACDHKLELNAKFSDNSTLKGETEISHAHKSIKKVWVTQDNHEKPQAIQLAIDAINNADQIVLGPGSLFTSILPNLMIHNLGHALLNSSAEVVYICNIMMQKGETDNFTDADHVKILNQHLGKKFIDTVLVNNKKIPTNYIDYNKYFECSNQVREDIKGLKKQNCRVISDDFLSLHDHGVFHNGDKVSNELLRLINYPKNNLLRGR